jgi:hypothetical protein
MPNWCYNNLDITATTDEQKELLERVSKAEASDGFIGMFLPLPEALRETVKGTGEEDQTVFVDGFNNWYDWQVANWGTKWDVDPLDVDFDGTTLSTSFDSAWSPPVAFYEWLQEQGFEVSANYYEPGMDYAGEWVDGDDFFLVNVSDIARQEESTIGKREYDILEQWNIFEEVAQMDADAEEMEENG